LTAISKSEVRNTKHIKNLKFQGSKQEISQSDPGIVLDFDILYSNLFRISCFEFRISNLVAALPRYLAT